MHSRILVPIKLKHAPQSDELMAKAVSMARAGGAEIIALTVVPEINDNLKVLPEDSLPDLQKFVEGQETSGVTIKSVVRTGQPHRAIPRAAAEFKCDLIVMNSHNPRIRDYVIGSTAGHVVMHAECDVLVVRQMT
ncbi:MAG: universal stress protein [Roseovarius sp.]|uniref:universal stress protein n=1 Tax=Roseovarius sp. TaxID=1486281 RepID=UPI0032F02DC0